MAKYAKSARGKAKKDNMKEAIIHGLANLESFPTHRNDWLPSLPEETPYLPKNRSDSAAERWLYRNFTSNELDEIEARAVQRRLGRYGGKVVHVLDELYRLATTSGDVQAAKEFLNRLLGQSKHHLTLEHETGNNLTSLLETIHASDAYARPKIDKDGREIVELSEDDVETLDIEGYKNDSTKTEKSGNSGKKAKKG